MSENRLYGLKCEHCTGKEHQQQAKVPTLQPATGLCFYTPQPGILKKNINSEPGKGMHVQAWLWGSGCSLSPTVNLVMLSAELTPAVHWVITVILSAALIGHPDVSSVLWEAGEEQGVCTRHSFCPLLSVSPCRKQTPLLLLAAPPAPGGFLRNGPTECLGLLSQEGKASQETFRKNVHMPQGVRTEAPWERDLGLAGWPCCSLPPPALSLGAQTKASLHFSFQYQLCCWHIPFCESIPLQPGMCDKGGEGESGWAQLGIACRTSNLSSKDLTGG